MPKEVKNKRVLYIKDWPGTKESANLVGYDGTGWYFWDEVYSRVCGPFLTEGDAKDALKNY